MMYVLNGKQVEKVEINEYSRWINETNLEKDCLVEVTQVGKLRISTVFLGLDHGASEKPEVFETMVFKENGITPLSKYLRRYSSWSEAEKGHKQVLEDVINIETTHPLLISDGVKNET